LNKRHFWGSCLARNLVGIEFLNSPWIVPHGLQSEVLHVFANDSRGVLAVGVRAAFARIHVAEFHQQSALLQSAQSTPHRCALCWRGVNCFVRRWIGRVGRIGGIGFGCE